MKVQRGWRKEEELMSERGGREEGRGGGSVKGLSRYEQVSGSRNKGSEIKEGEGVDEVKVRMVETKQEAGEEKRENEEENRRGAGSRRK